MPEKGRAQTAARSDQATELVRLHLGSTGDSPDATLVRINAVSSHDGSLVAAVGWFKLSQGLLEASTSENAMPAADGSIGPNVIPGANGTQSNNEAASSGFTRLRVWNSSTWNVVSEKQIQWPVGVSGQIRFLQKSNLLLIAVNNKIDILDPKSLNAVKSLTVPDNVTRVDESPRWPLCCAGDIRRSLFRPTNWI
jgi:hypothetical protein